MPIDTGTWEIVNPLGDGTFNQNGGVVSIGVPGGVAHDQWTVNTNAPKLLQMSKNTDFAIQARLTTPLTARFQMAGLLVQQDAANFLRYDVFHDGAALRIFAATIAGGVNVNRVNLAIATGFPIDLRIERVGNNWTLLRSANGLNWVEDLTFTYIMTVTKAGLFAGNNTPNPAYTASFDYYLVDYGRNGITGDLAVTEDFFDSANFSAQVNVAAELNTHDGDEELDNCYFEAYVAIKSQLSAVESFSDSSVFSGKVQITSALNVTDTPDTAKFYAFVSPGNNITMLLAATETFFDTAQFVGSAGISGNLNTTETFFDTAIINATVPINSVLNATENLLDSAAITGLVTVKARLSAVETVQDTASFSVSVQWPDRHADLNATENFHDSASFTGKVEVRGALMATDGPDSAAFFGYVTWPDRHANLNATETFQDSASITGKVEVKGQMTATENFTDSAAFQVMVTSSASLDVTEGFHDTAAFSAKAVIKSILDAIEDHPDTALFEGIVRWPDLMARLNATEDFFDTGAFTGSVGINGSLSAVEPQDIAAFACQVEVAGLMTATEDRVDTAAFVMKKNVGWIDAELSVGPAIDAQVTIDAL